jgi:hypothetical protein
VKNTTWMVAGMVLALATGSLACKKSEDSAVDAAPSATASAAPDPTPSATATEAPKPVPPKVTNVGVDISGCCAALRSDGAKAAAQEKGAFQAAAAVCDSLAPKTKTGAMNATEAKRTIRAQLQRVHNVPGACN